MEPTIDTGCPCDRAPDCFPHGHTPLMDDEPWCDDHLHHDPGLIAWPAPPEPAAVEEPAPAATEEEPAPTFRPEHETITDTDSRPHRRFRV